MSRSVGSKMVTASKMFNQEVYEPLFIYGETPEIEAALKECIEEIWGSNPIDESTGTIRREHIGYFIKNKLSDIEDATLNNDEFDKFYYTVDPTGSNRLTKD
mmetsp:Transcript_45219/g.60007  ORF Transcript_45219/g.60007 Transcript_45219/m.60007 type:complete len:102 (+) Transcript_45219:29-334(+)